MQYNVQYIQKISAEEFKIEGRLRYTIRASICLFFAQRNVTDEASKLQLAFSGIPDEVLSQFRDLIFNAPTEREPFTVFKQLCLNRSKDSGEQGGVEECSGSDVPVELDSQIWSLITHYMTDRGRIVYYNHQTNWLAFPPPFEICLNSSHAPKRYPLDRGASFCASWTPFCR
ncbi:hypothetical protein T10_4326 [Trichinella papuae]|uniref:DUF7041 domain-containing protein n=1 Tax=Trichinella papuae TaxID=268474 RepID=A0A0V1N3H9_9BILA|nr:hypothetical protein T10_4326 [Trichinella papuae]